jgi:DNA-binding XRE family transcriptional regulator
MSATPRKKRPRAHPHFVWADPARFHLARRTAGLTQVETAYYLGVTERTMRNWETGRTRIPYPAFKLVRMRARAIVHAPGWEGWSFARDGALVTPDGRSFQPWELAQLQLVVSLSRRYLDARRKPLPLPGGIGDTAAAARSATAAVASNQPRPAVSPRPHRTPAASPASSPSAAPATAQAIDRRGHVVTRRPPARHPATGVCGSAECAPSARTTAVSASTKLVQKTRRT